MKNLLLACVALSALAGGSAMAQNSFTDNLSFNIGATNNYVWRGQSQSNKDAAVQGGIDWSNGNFYVGGWASSVDFGDDADAELDIYAGVTPTVGNWSFDFGAVYYTYPGSDDVDSTGELKAAFTHPLGRGSIGSALYVDWESLEDPYYEINAAYPLLDKLSISGAIGKWEAGDYTTWNVGLGYDLTDVIALDLRYHDTGDHDLAWSPDGRGLAKSQVTFGITASF